MNCLNLFIIGFLAIFSEYVVDCQFFDGGHHGIGHGFGGHGHSMMGHGSHGHGMSGHGLGGLSHGHGFGQQEQSHHSSNSIKEG